MVKIIYAISEAFRKTKHWQEAYDAKSKIDAKSYFLKPTHFLRKAPKTQS